MQHSVFKSPLADMLSPFDKIRPWFLLVRCGKVCISVACQFSDHYLGFFWQCSPEIDSDFGVLNDKGGYRNDTMSSFQTRPDSVYSILLIVYLSGDSEGTENRLLAIDIRIVALYQVCWFEQPLGTPNAHL